ncbi:hypothetical protein BB559_001450 [Furculomyces boomerangus]|uniref:carnosine N-methyltransferase n=2 Tax=Harpellales TaxID=61421 RepID=A0A2T9Z1Y6_9FUNG|nr:hypothetical protein BB559_001450 [Furculomyces boomerangus]PWA03553.1 hypothetical protein BB558_000243 [Smittium angustum]
MQSLQEQSCGNGHSVDENDDYELEKQAINDIVAAFLYYKTYSSKALVYNRLKQIDSLPESHRKQIVQIGTIHKLKAIEKLIDSNYSLFLNIVYQNSIIFEDGILKNDIESSETVYDNIKEISEFFSLRRSKGLPPALPHHLDKLKSILNSFVRDWSDEGARERELTYTPVLQALEDIFSDCPVSNRSSLKVLVPGAGLGRLAFEIASRGFTCQGNEFSYFMLMSSNYILNHCKEKFEINIYPFIHQFSNVLNTEDQLRPVSIPDISPFQSFNNGMNNFSMAGGDFVQVYQDDNEIWDAVVTCFFIDTAKNPVHYLETIYKILKKGGVWINIGPLLWHFEDIPGESSVELTFQELMVLISNVGFSVDIKSIKMDIQSPYSENKKSMLKYIYNTPFFIARKKEVNMDLAAE